MKSIYEQLEAHCLPLIEAYHADLTKHDREAIENNPDVPFLHWTRRSGTWLIHLWPLEKLPKKGERVKYLFGTADREHIVREAATLARSFVNDRDGILCCYYFDGQKLWWLTVGEAYDRARQYHHRMLDLFDGKAVAHA